MEESLIPGFVSEWAGNTPALRVHPRAASLCTADASHYPPQNITMVTRPRAERSAAVETPVAIETVMEQD